MSDTDTSVMQEAALDPTNQSVPMGYYKTRAGQVKRIGRASSITKYSDPNNFAPLPNGATGHPFGDEIVIRVDRFSDEATCRDCRGSGHSDSTCGDCGGNKGSWYDASGSKDNRSTADR